MDNLSNRNYEHKKRVPHQTEPFPTTKQLRQLLQSQNNICGICNFPFVTFDLDHIVQIANGGLHILRNIRFTHVRCNRSRSKTAPRLIVPTWQHDDGISIDTVPW